jgi:hypothetical protein
LITVDKACFDRSLFASFNQQETETEQGKEANFSSCGVVPYQRLAVQRRGRRTNGSLMLLQFPCGDCVRCNGLLGGARKEDLPCQASPAVMQATCEGIVVLSL